MPRLNDPEKIYEVRMTEDFLLNQVNGYFDAENWQDIKHRLSINDSLYRGDFTGLFPDETALPHEPLVENKLKNAIHDLARLSSEGRGTPRFPVRGESVTEQVKARIREGVSETIWQMGFGKRIERKLYMDMLGAGFAAVAVFYNDESEYPQFMRLNPRYCYFDVRNGRLQDMLTVETLHVRKAARLFPELNIEPVATMDDTCLLTTYYDDYEVAQCLIRTKGGRAQNGVEIVSHWVHKLDCVPVAFEQLDTYDDVIRGTFDQLGGPMMIRNKVVRLLADYLETMAHAPLETKGILEPIEDPGPLTRYTHDENAEESFVRRVPPAAPANAVFGLLQYMDTQESLEAVQPPARVGQVSQSIASGNFVNSTQGTLSSAVVELQDNMSYLRYQINYIAFKVDAKYLDKLKPLVQPVGKKKTYKPSSDMGEHTMHKIVYGATAGLRPIDADVRVLQHLGAGLISKETARAQIDYIADDTTEQNKIDREQLSMLFFQRLTSDASQPLSLVAQIILQMALGESLVDAVAEIAPQLVEAEAQAAPEGPLAPPGVTEAPAEEAAALAAGGIPEAEVQPFEPEFAPPPLQQQIVRNPI